MRDERIYENPDGSDNKRLISDSTSRAIWRQDHTHARYLCTRIRFASTILGFSEDGSIYNKDPERFDNMFTELSLERSNAKLSEIQKERSSTSSLTGKAELIDWRGCVSLMLIRNYFI